MQLPMAVITCPGSWETALRIWLAVSSRKNLNRIYSAFSKQRQHIPLWTSKLSLINFLDKIICPWRL
jgi:hypothetical protein